MSKNKQPTAPTVPDGVDMDKIKAMMGPLPDETATSNESEKTHESSESVAAAAEEANEALKAMDPELGATKIQKVEDSEEPLPEVSAMPEAKKEATSTNLIEDEATEKAVDEIVEHESDVVLETEDEEREIENAEFINPKESFKDKLKKVWANKKARWAIIVFVVLGILTLAVVPGSRYFVLNTAGVRAGLSIKVLDGSTLQPLKNVEVSAASVTAKTGDDGTVKLTNVKLGATKLSIKKRAFGTIDRNITVGWGSNPQGEVKLAATGAQYTFIVKDYLSNKPIEAAAAASGEGNAVSDKDGKLVLTLDTSDKKDGETVEVTLTAAGYREEKVSMAVDNKTSQEVKLVPSRKHVFVSKRSGTFDVYSIDVDGKNEKKLVTGTGVERDDIALLPDKTGSYVAYAATRENVRNSDGYLLTTIYIIEVSDGSLTKVDQSEQIQLVGWSSDSRIAYVKIVAGTSAANPDRTKILSYNVKNDKDKKELASANYFNNVSMFGSKVYYAPGSEGQKSPKPGLYSVALDGTTRSTILDKAVWDVFRTSYDTFQLNVSNTWYVYKLGGTTASTSGGAATTNSRLYTDSPNGKASVWVDERDGKGVLISYDTVTAKETVLVTKSGLKAPIYWLDDKNVVFRVNDSKEIADYVVSVNGGDAKKLATVTDTLGADRWFY